MKVYNYDNEGYLIGVSELDDSDKCQITGDWLIPGMATDKEPLETKEGYEVKFQNGDWQYIKLLTDEEKKIQGILPLEDGEKIVDGVLVIIEKPSDLHSWNGTEWYLDDEKVLESKKPNLEILERNRLEMIVLDLMTEMGMI